MRVPLLALALVAGPALAQSPAADADCAAAKVALPAELAGWGEQTPVSAGTKPGDGATVEIGRAARVSLHPARHLSFAMPAKSPADANGGTLSLAVVKPGTYRVALGGVAWVDLARDGKPVASAAHAHGPKCSGIRKTVDYALTPGNYTIQLSGSSEDAVALLVARLG